jgi:hypothetical protein
MMFQIKSGDLAVIYLCDAYKFPSSDSFPFNTDTYSPTYLIRSSYTFRVSRVFFHFNYFTDGRTPWTSDQLAARPLPKQRKTQTQKKHIHIPNIHAFCGIRTHDPDFRASEDNTCLRPPGYRDRLHIFFRSKTR